MNVLLWSTLLHAEPWNPNEGPLVDELISLSDLFICKELESPISTLHIDKLSEFSCLTTDKTFPKTMPLTFNEQSIRDSTSKPPIDSFSDKSSGVVFISTRDFNQF